jgi:hypothetical protein
MSAEPYISCDARPDGDLCPTYDRAPGARTFGESRRLLAKQGWHQRPGGRDICPGCWTAGHR